MQSEATSALVSTAAAALVPLVRLVMRLALRRRSRRRRKKQLEHLRLMLRAPELKPAGGWQSAAWNIACEASVGVVEGVVSGDVEASVARAIHASRLDAPRVAMAVLRSAGCYVEALRSATSSKRRLFAALHATVALYRLALFQELCASTYGLVSYRGVQLATGPIATARAVRVFHETACAMRVPCAVCVLMHREGGLVVLSVTPETALCGLVVGAAIDRSALTAMRSWVTNECVGERATIRVAGNEVAVFALYADEEQLVAVDAEERHFATLHAIFLAEHTVAVRVERGGVVTETHTARASHAHGVVGMDLETALQNGHWLGEPCVSRAFDVGGAARVVLVTLCRAAWV